MHLSTIYIFFFIFNIILGGMMQLNIQFLIIDYEKYWKPQLRSFNRDNRGSSVKKKKKRKRLSFVWGLFCVNNHIKLCCAKSYGQFQSIFKRTLKVVNILWIYKRILDYINSYSAVRTPSEATNYVLSWISFDSFQRQKGLPEELRRRKVEIELE